jgi:hypothetical protein
MKTTLEKLEKARKSLSNHVSRGGRNTCHRGYYLVDTYMDLRKLANHENVWAAYCEMYGLSVDHDAYDFFA